MITSLSSFVFFFVFSFLLWRWFILSLERAHTHNLLWFTRRFECVRVSWAECAHAHGRASAINKFNLALDIVQPFFNSHTYATQFNSQFQITRALKTTDFVIRVRYPFYSFPFFLAIDSLKRGMQTKRLKIERHLFFFALCIRGKQTFHIMWSESITVEITRNGKLQM